MSDKIVASVGILVGSIAILLQLANAFGADLSSDQQDAIASVAGVVGVLVAAWFHPAVPVGKQA